MLHGSRATRRAVCDPGHRPGPVHKHQAARPGNRGPMQLRPGAHGLARVPGGYLRSCASLGPAAPPGEHQAAGPRPPDRATGSGHQGHAYDTQGDRARDHGPRPGGLVSRYWPPLRSAQDHKQTPPPGARVSRSDTPRPGSAAAPGVKKPGHAGPVSGCSCARYQAAAATVSRSISHASGPAVSSSTARDFRAAPDPNQADSRRVPFERPRS